MWLWCPLVANLAALILAFKCDASRDTWLAAMLQVRGWVLGGCWVGAASRPLLRPAHAAGPPPRRSPATTPTAACPKSLVSQLPALCTLTGTLAAGVVLDVEACRAVGATFAFLYLGTKLGEMRWQE